MSTAVAPPAGASELTQPKGRKWIAREIESLDVESDYARIWALTTIYYGDDVLVNLLYTTGMPCFTQSPFGSELLINRSKRAKEKKHERAWDTLAHFWRWFEYGPEHIDAERSIEMVNRIHTAMWKVVEEAFSNDDFIYTTSWLATFLHRLKLDIGLSGFTEKQKASAHLFWAEVTARMRGPHGTIHSYPKSFAEMQEFVAEFESRPWEQVDSGRQLGQYAIEQFNEAQLPKTLWGLGRQVVLTVQAPHIRALHQMGDPNPVAAFLIRRALATKIWFAERVKADPRQSTPEKARAKGEIKEQHREPRLVDASACPFHSARVTE